MTRNHIDLDLPGNFTLAAGPGDIRALAVLHERVRDYVEDVIGGRSALRRVHVTSTAEGRAAGLYIRGDHVRVTGRLRRASCGSMVVGWNTAAALAQFGQGRVMADTDPNQVPRAMIVNTLSRLDTALHETVHSVAHGEYRRRTGKDIESPDKTTLEHIYAVTAFEESTTSMMTQALMPGLLDYLHSADVDPRFPTIPMSEYADSYNGGRTAFTMLYDEAARRSGVGADTLLRRGVLLGSGETAYGDFSALLIAGAADGATISPEASPQRELDAAVSPFGNLKREFRSVRRETAWGRRAAKHALKAIARADRRAASGFGIG